MFSKIYNNSNFIKKKQQDFVEIDFIFKNVKGDQKQLSFFKMTT